jgi:hypothetical protein
MNEVDAMLERGDEFVLGDVEEGEDFMAEEPRPSAQEVVKEA